MAQKQWGHCMHCKFFASKARQPMGSEEARCVQPVLSKYELRVFGSCGCTGFELRPGLPADVEQPAMPII